MVENRKIEVIPSINEELKSPLYRYFKYCCKVEKEIIVLYPGPYDDLYEKFLEEISGNTNKLILFFSDFDLSDKLFEEAYKNYLFIINHYVSKVIKVPFEIKELKNIKCKKYLLPKEIENYYNGIRGLVREKNGNSKQQGTT